MRRTLSILSTFAIAATAALSLTAAPLAVKKHGGGGTAKTALSRSAISDLQTGSNTAVGGKNGRFVAPKTRPAGAKGIKGLTPTRSYARVASKKSMMLAGENLPQLNGIVIGADNWGYNSKEGLYALPTTPGSDFELIFKDPYGAGVVVGDRLYTIARITMLDFDIDYPRYTVYNMETGEEIFYKNYQDNTDWSIMPVDMDVDPTTGQVYAITFNKEMNGYQLSKMFFTDKEVTSTLVSGLSDNWNSIAFDAQGQLYGISKTNVIEGNYWVCVGSTLNKIDKTNGVVTKIGETGQCPEYMSSATIDKTTGRMFWTISPAELAGYLAEVDLTTGAATIVKTFDHAEEVLGLYAPAPAAAESAPAKVQNLQANFPNGAMSGKVSFTAPTTHYNGSAATGSLTYEVTANGEVVATGTTSYGAQVEADVTLTTAGEYKIGASVSNTAGKSPEATTTLFIGTGVPMAPYVTLSYRNGSMLLTWSDIEESVDGGYIDPAQVTYTIKRYPDGTIVSSNQTTAAFSEQIPAPDTFTSYYYGVTANYNGKSSTESLSNRVALGELVPPYNETFDNETCMSGWTIIDVAGDHRMWMWSTMQNLRISFDQAMPKDDWAITPAFRLEAGRVYQMSFQVFCDDPSYPERIEVKMGASNTIAAMEKQIVAPTEVISTVDAPQTITATITPEESGTYFIGFHAISDADRYVLNLDNVKIESGLDTGAPSAATNLKAVADPSGAYKATVSFTTPTTSIAGGAQWQAYRKVEVLRNGEPCKEFSSASPGDQLSFTDTMEAAGNYTYTVYCYNMFGKGMPASTTVYVGIDKPAKPASATIVETANEGEVAVSWAAVTTDLNGNSIPSSKVTYMIAEYGTNGWIPLHENITETSKTFKAVEGYQDLVQYAVFAKTEGGYGEGVLTDLIPVGPAFKGIKESFPNGQVTTLWGTRNIQNSTFALFGDESGVPAQDGDNGFMAMIGEAYNDSGALFSGKVSLANISNPGLSFYTYNINANNTNEIVVGVREAGAPSYTTVKTVRVNEVCGAEEWGKVTVSLAEYAGKTIQVQLLMTIKAYPVVTIDNVEIGSMVDNDLAITGITAPEIVKTGTAYTVSVTVANEGTKSAASYSVDLFANGIKADTKQGGALAAGQQAAVNFDCYMHALAKESIEYYAVVTTATDEVPSNNNSKFVEVFPKASQLPAPEQLKVTASGSGIQLNWNAPDLSKAVAEEVTLDLEDAESFVHALDGWIFVDVDGSAMGGFNDMNDTPIPVPGILPGSTKGSFFVFDASYEQFDNSYAAHSGSKYLAALFRFDDGQTDDWAISPELDGSEQTLSFFAKSFSGNYPEYIQILYSTGSTDTNDFQPLCDLTKVPSDWAQLAITLPAGAKRFAIRSSSQGSFMLMIDDISFTPAASTMNLTLAGYNVYRDGEQLNLSPVSDTLHLDAEGTADHKYVVTAIYDGKGESGASNEASLNSGLEEIELNAAIYAADGCIVLSGMGNATATIYTIDGITLYKGAGDAEVAAAPGVYVVKAGKTIVKVVVK